MNLPVLTALSVIFILWINYEIHKNSRQLKENTERFWNRERKSNQSRNTDISALNYILISADRLPTAESEDGAVNEYRDLILGLSGKKAMNLSGYTNTELKLQYGAANLKQLTECDNNYITLVSILQKWAQRLYDLGDTDHAAAILEYAVDCHSDVDKTYQLLAIIYIEQGNSDKIKELLDIIPSTEIRCKDKLIKELMQRNNF